MKRTPLPGLMLPGLVLLSLATPFLLSDYALRVMNLSLIASLAVIGLCIAFGWAGLIQLGQAAFVGVGAYASAVLSRDLGVPFWLAVPLAALLAGVAAVLIGFPLLRLRGHYLALATVGLNATAVTMISNAGAWSGGYDGLSDIPPMQFGGWVLTTDTQSFFLIWVVVAAVSLSVLALRASRYGRALVAVRDDEMAAGTSGVPVVAMKALAYGLCGVCAGLSGALYAHYSHYISPGDFDLVHSITLLVMLIVGGETSVFGALLGSVLLGFLPEWLRFVGEGYLAVFGIGVLLVLVLMPQGIVGLMRRLTRREAAHG